MRNNKLLLKTIGWIVILVGVSNIYIGATSVIQKWGHDLSAAIMYGIYALIAGISLLKQKKLGIVMMGLPIGIVCALITQIIIFGKPASPIALSVLIMMLVSVEVILFSQWNTCTWK